MTTYADRPKGAITYPQWLLNRIAEPGMICAPPVITDRAWWQHLPGLNPYHELEQRAWAAERNGRPKPGNQRVGPPGPHWTWRHGGPSGQTTHPAGRGMRWLLP